MAIGEEIQLGTLTMKCFLFHILHIQPAGWAVWGLDIMVKDF